MPKSATKRPCTCDVCDKTPGAAYTLDQCRRCYKYHHRDETNLAWGGPGLPYARPLPCRHRGQELGRVACSSCRGSVQLKTFSCSLHMACTVAKPLAGYATCRTCPDYRPQLPEPVSQRQFTGLLPGHNLNPSLCQYQGRHYLACRHRWSGAKLVLCEIDEEGRARGPSRILFLGRFAEDAFGQEDPRLFVFQDQLHVSYTGVSWQDGQIVTSILVARINPEGQVLENFCPHYAERRYWEKNWVFFDQEGQLCCVYQPHRVLSLDEQHRATEVAPADSLPWWPYGERRGGAAPILHNGEWYHFFHSRLPRDNGYYTLGVYTFEAKAPFRVSRVGRHPLVLPEGRKPAAHLPSVIYPGGAVFRDGCWWISYGRWDVECWLATWSEQSIEDWLVPLAEARQRLQEWQGVQ